MAYGRQANPAMIRKDSVSTVQGGLRNTAKLQHELTGNERLVITLKNTTANDITNVPIFNGYKGKRPYTAKNMADAAAQGVDIVMTVEGFASIEDFADYYGVNKVLIEGGKYSTSDTDNLVGAFVHVMKYPQGTGDKTVNFDIDTFRVNLGSSYQKEGSFKPEKLRWMLTPALNILLSKLKANSTIELTFNVTGFENSAEVGAIEANVIR